MLRKGSDGRNEAFALIIPFVITDFLALLDAGHIVANKTDLILNLIEFAS